MVIETVLIVYYALLALNFSIISVSLKTWAWLQLGRTQNMGVVAPRGPCYHFEKSPLLEKYILCLQRSHRQKNSCPRLERGEISYCLCSISGLQESLPFRIWEFDQQLQQQLKRVEFLMKTSGKMHSISLKKDCSFESNL